ncbi:hypothetical protein [Methylovirgula sp. HY1]|nr:hypothetical protein [Methylovirgula sp. HY1]
MSRPRYGRRRKLSDDNAPPPVVGCRHSIIKLEGAPSNSDTICDGTK